MWLFAQQLNQVKPQNRDPWREPEVIWGTVLIAVALLAGAVLLWLIERWRKREAAPPDSAGELTDYRGMYERGEITEDEYAKLRDKVATRVKPAPADRPVLPVDLGTEDDTPGPPKPNDGGPANPPPPA